MVERRASHPAPDLEIVEGRHPVIELQEMSSGSERFVPNDLFLDASTHNIVVLTGPNMGGKSTYLRQAALIVIMAQMGSFVPARAARLGSSTVSSPASAPATMWPAGAQPSWSR